MNIKKLISDNMPLILTSTAVAGVLSTSVLAVRATPQAIRDIWDAESEHDRSLTNVEKIRLTWKGYIPAATMGALTISAIVGVQSIHSRRQAALVGLYSITERAFTEYRDKVVEVIGEQKNKDIKDAISKDRIDADPVENSQVIITGNGDHLCYDTYTGVYFNSNIESIKKAVNEVNAECINNSYASQNDFYRRVGLPLTVFGEEVGWRPDHMLEIDFSSHLSSDGQPCLAIAYRTDPIRGYYKGY